MLRGYHEMLVRHMYQLRLTLRTLAWPFCQQRVAFDAYEG